VVLLLLVGVVVLVEEGVGGGGGPEVCGGRNGEPASFNSLSVFIIFVVIGRGGRARPGAGVDFDGYGAPRGLG
jgi:hypothetical protein